MWLEVLSIVLLFILVVICDNQWAMLGVFDCQIITGLDFTEGMFGWRLGEKGKMLMGFLIMATLLRQLAPYLFWLRILMTQDSGIFLSDVCWQITKQNLISFSLNKLGYSRSFSSLGCILLLSCPSASPYIKRWKSLELVTFKRSLILLKTVTFCKLWEYAKKKST